jgi:hypothetical protein
MGLAAAALQRKCPRTAIPRAAFPPRGTGLWRFAAQLTAVGLLWPRLQTNPAVGLQEVAGLELAQNHNHGTLS